MDSNEAKLHAARAEYARILEEMQHLKVKKPWHGDSLPPLSYVFPEWCSEAIQPKRQSDEPLISAEVAAYLAEWFAK